MTYAWPSVSTFGRHQCIGTTASGDQCLRWRWAEQSEVPGGYLCHLHLHQDGVEEPSR